MSGLDATAAFAHAVVDEWARSGVTRAVVAPGSRNTPLVLALARHAAIEVDVVIDERSAAFRALGMALADGRPAVVCCTSGTAAANLFPAVIEAHHARVPLLVCTADRPPELRDCGAGQTIDQTRLYGTAVRWFHDPGPPDSAPGAEVSWRALACRAYAAAVGSPPGPVHLNLPFREPLVPLEAQPRGGRSDGRSWVETMRPARAPDDATVARVVELVRANPRGVVVAGWGCGASPSTVERFARAAGWPMLADATSGVRAGSRAVSTYEALLRAEEFAAASRPDGVLRIGAPLTSKVAGAWLATPAMQILVDPDDVWLDPQRATTDRVVADVDALLGAVTARLPSRSTATEWERHWRDAELRARAALDAVLDAEPAVEGRIARDAARALPDGAILAVASSLPVRALEWCMEPRGALRVVSNRGANGIDGFVSSTIGLAHASGAPTVGLCGDLCFLHDTNGLLAAGRDLAVTFLIVDNGGGGIFSYLPQRELPELERYFTTPQGVDVAEVARAHGASAVRVDGLGAVDWLPAHGGLDVVVVTVDPGAARAAHSAMWDAVAAAVVRS